MTKTKPESTAETMTKGQATAVTPPVTTIKPLCVQPPGTPLVQSPPTCVTPALVTHPVTPSVTPSVTPALPPATLVQYPSIAQESQEAVIEELIELAVKLQVLLPDPSLSPLERVERLARVVPESIQNGSEHLTARKKLNQIRLRLAELIPDAHMTTAQKIDALVAKVHALVPGTTARLFEKLEKIGDCRMLDNGGVPFAGWTPDHRFWPHLRKSVRNDLADECLSKNLSNRTVKGPRPCP